MFMCPAKRFVAKNMLMLQCLTEFSLFFSFENRGLSIIPKHKSRLFSRENVAFITYAIRASQYAKFCDLGIVLAVVSVMITRFRLHFDDPISTG